MKVGIRELKAHLSKYGCSTLVSFDHRRREVAAGFGLGLVPQVRE